MKCEICKQGAEINMQLAWCLPLKNVVIAFEKESWRK